MIDPVELTSQLVRCPSVTPIEGGALRLLDSVLSEAGFQCERVDRGGIPNLFARWGDSGATFGFNGHTDVVPVGDIDSWTVDPFGGEIRNGKVWGRGATDMKSAVAAFVTASLKFLESAPPDGSIIITVTGDEEAIAQDGTIAILDWMRDNDQHMDVCIVGEPSCPRFMGEAIKIGRRGSVSAKICITGRQGHSAYPDRFLNPLTAMAELAHNLARHELDTGTIAFQPSNVALTSIDTGNTATNVVPAKCNATVNVRFSDLHTSESILDWIRHETDTVAAKHGVKASLAKLSSSESFLTEEGEFSNLVANAVEAEIGRRPEFSTTGGTSDARFICSVCPVVEFGLVSKTIHQVDEHVEIEHIRSLESVYVRCLQDFFA